MGNVIAQINVVLSIKKKSFLICISSYRYSCESCDGRSRCQPSRLELRECQMTGV